MKIKEIERIISVIIKDGKYLADGKDSVDDGIWVDEINKAIRWKKELTDISVLKGFGNQLEDAEIKKIKIVIAFYEEENSSI